MDGSTFKSSDTDDATSNEAAPAGISAGLPHIFRAQPDTTRHWLAVLAAAAAHVCLLAALSPQQPDTLGEDGIALETVAVSIVDSVPVFSAPETAASNANVRQPETEADDAPTESQPETPLTRSEDKPNQPVERKQAPVLDLPPDVVPPPDAPSLPPRQPNAQRDPTPPVVEETPSPTDTPRETALASPTPPPAPAAAAALPSVSSAEASPGTVRAYAASVSRLLDRQKPRNRGMKGQVRIQFVIDPAGRAAPPLVLATSGNANLDNLVVTAIQRMDFPAPPPEMSLRQRTFNVPFAFR